MTAEKKFDTTGIKEFGFWFSLLELVVKEENFKK